MFSFRYRERYVDSASEIAICTTPDVFRRGRWEAYGSSFDEKVRVRNPKTALCSSVRIKCDAGDFIVNTCSALRRMES